MGILKILTAAISLLVATPVVAQTAGPIGPGSDRGLEPSYNNGYDCFGCQKDEFRMGRGAGDAVGTAGIIAPFVRSKATSHRPSLKE
jgi:hypothetical protein